jgi:ATP-binding protein involved in chromosome partitioning
MPETKKGFQPMSHEPCDPERLRETLAKIRKKYIVLSGKGGVGKSTVAVNLAVGFALRGKKAGLLDSDLHGPSVPTMLGLGHFKLSGDEKHLFPAELYDGRLKVMSMQFLLRGANDSVIWRGPLKHSVIAQFIGYTVWGDLDYLIIDSPPGTGDEPLSVVQTAKPDGAIVVTTPQAVATFDVRKSIDFCRKLDLPVTGVIENMSGFACPHCGQVTDIFGSGGGEKMAKETDVPCLGRIPLEPGFVTHSDNGRAIVDVKFDSRSLAVIAGIIERLLK